MHTPRKRSAAATPQYRHGLALPGHQLKHLCRDRWPGQALRDAHMFVAFDVLEHSLEPHEAPDEYDRPWLAAISGPSAKPGANPGGMSQRAGRMRVLLPGGLAFEGLADALDQRLISGGAQIAS